MRIVARFILFACLLAAQAAWGAAPATVPATAPVRTSDMEPLVDGTVRFSPPVGWTMVGKNPNGLGAMYRLPDGSAVIEITVMPQDRAIAESSRDPMARMIDKGIRQAAAKAGQTIVLTPTQEDDPRFFLKMHDAIQVEGKIADRIQMYRILGLNLVLVAATANVDALEQAKVSLETAEQVAATMRVSRGAKRMVYPHAQLRAVVPLDWADQKTDQANGLVATYRDPKNPSRQIILSARVIPKSARDDNEKLNALIAAMADQERNLPPSLAQDKAGAQDIPGTTFVRDIRMKAMGPDGETRIDTRYLVIGDVLASVRSIAPQADADAVGALAEHFASSLKPLKE